LFKPENFSVFQIQN